MKIGKIDLGDRPVGLAPMEDVTDRSFRLICREQGADMVYTEIVSAEALVRNIPSTIRKLSIDKNERPAAIQIYGREPEPMAEAARMAAQACPDFIDINFGCPVKKVAGKGAGAGLLRKIIVQLAEQLQDCGIQALTVHGRTRSQMYTGEADWEEIARVKDNPRLHIPVIGNGDITTPEKALEAFDRYGVDGILVGRASIGAPWIFSDIQAAVHPDRNIPQIGIAEKFGLLKRQILESVSRIDEYRGILHIRRHLAASPIFKGIPSFRPTRIAMLQASTLDELLQILSQVQESLQAS